MLDRPLEPANGRRYAPARWRTMTSAVIISKSALIHRHNRLSRLSLRPRIGYACSAFLSACSPRPS
jgi:hypothetical protein